MTAASFASRLLTLGGDRRITVRPGQNTNQYGSSPFPRSTLGYASSTANDISLPAFDHLQGVMAAWPEAATSDGRFYADALESLRRRMRAAWRLNGDTQIVFAPSGTDLEYVALTLAGPKVTNVLIGADEVGSGCALSAGGRYFAKETALLAAAPKGAAIAGLEDTLIYDIAVRDKGGAPRSSDEIAAAIAQIAADAQSAGRTCLVHVVYGSKTGLILPALDELHALMARFPGLKVVVDACQARVTGKDIAALLARDCIVLMTGSKFMGGPPFSGFALVPPAWADGAVIAPGLADVFRRGEWPESWPGCDVLPDGSNPGLLLRLEAALFELERFLAIDGERVDAVIGRFGHYVRALAAMLGAGLVAPCLAPGALHTSTLATLDLTALPARPDFAAAQRLHKVLAARGLRLGQPVKCIPQAGGWGGTLRLSLSMPLIGELAALGNEELDIRLSKDMGRIGAVIAAAQRIVA